MLEEDLLLFSLWKRKLGGNMYSFYKHTMRINNRDGKELFKLKNNVGIKINGYKISIKICKLEIRRWFLTISEGFTTVLQKE